MILSITLKLATTKEDLIKQAEAAVVLLKKEDANM